jgi:hypothetical protein
MRESWTSDIALARALGIRPTAIERSRGRLLRAPDHDAGTGGGDTPPASPVADTPPAAPAGDTPPAEQPAAPVAPSGETPPAAADPESSLLGGEKKPDGETPPAAETPPAPVVPEKYELTVEGVELDAAAIEEATPIFKEMGLTNDQANQLMPAATKFRDGVAQATLQQIMDAGAKQKADWAEASRADPDIGGGKLEETLHLSGKALDALGYPEGSDFRKVLTETGFGNHPEMVRMMRKIGEMVSEDGFPRPGAVPASQISAEKRLYPND